MKIEAIRRMIGQKQILMAGFGFAVTYWIIESLMDTFAFHEGSLYLRLIHPDPNEIWMRSLIICLFVLFAMYTQRTIQERKLAGEALQEAHDKLELRVQERTTELTKTNEQLQREIEERKAVEEALRNSEHDLHLLSMQLLTVQENERSRVALELHDSVSQTLSAIKFKLEQAVGQETDGRTKECTCDLDGVIHLIQALIEEVRSIYTDLRPSFLDDLGIVPTIPWFSREFQKTYSDIHIEKKIDIEENEIPESLKIIMYRLLQEIMSNVAKHSEADVVQITLRKKDDSLEFSVEDNGRGFDPKEAVSVEDSKRGFGLGSMRERTELSGGSFSIESAQGAGAVIRASWPSEATQSD